MGLRGFFSSFVSPETEFRLHRPIVGWTSAIVLGTALGFFYGGGLFWLCVATCTCFCAWRKGAKASLLLCLTLLALVAWRASAVHDRVQASRERVEDIEEEGEPFELTATVSPDRRIVERKRGGPYCRFTADHVRLADGSELPGITFHIFYYDKRGLFPLPGETWRMIATLRHGNLAYRRNLSVRGERAYHLPEEDRHDAPRYRIAAFRNRLAEHLALGVSPEEAGLTQTMTLGTRSRMTYQTRQRYADAGIIHIFAISGLHVGIVAGLLVWLFAYAGLTLRLRAFLFFPALVAYLLLIDVPPSAARACLMAIIYCFAPCFLRRPSAASAFFFTAAAVLLVEPSWIANAGALLSFGVLGGILLYLHPLAYLFNFAMGSRKEKKPLGTLPQPPAWHMRLRRGVATLLALTLSAWLASIPLCLYFFGRFSLAGLLLNLFVPSLTLVIVWCACLSVGFGFVLPIVSVLLNRFNAFLLALVDACSSCLLEQPWAVVELSDSISPALMLLLEGVFIALGLLLQQVERYLRARDPRDPQLRFSLPALNVAKAQP